MFALLLALFAASAQETPRCGALPPLDDQAVVVPLLDGFLTALLPGELTVSALPHGPTSPPVPSGEGVLFRITAGDDHLAVLAQRMHMIASAQFPDDVLDVIDPTMHRAQLLTADGTRGLAWWSDAPPTGASDKHALDVLWALKGGELVQTSFLVDDLTASRGPDCAAYALTLARHMLQGNRAAPRGARAATVPFTAKRDLVLALADGMVLVARPGPDVLHYDVDLLHEIADGYAGMTLTVGHTPRPLPEGDTVSGRLAGLPTQWVQQSTPDHKRRTLDAAVALDRDGLVLRVSLEGTVEDTVRLREVIEHARRVRARPAAQSPAVNAADAP